MGPASSRLTYRESYPCQTLTIPVLPVPLQGLPDKKWLTARAVGSCSVVCRLPFLSILLQLSWKEIKDDERLHSVLTHISA